MQNIYGKPGESIEKMNNDRFIQLHGIDRRYREILREIHNWEIWITWEREVARVLENLAMKDVHYTVIHDVPFQPKNTSHKQNIDHIVIYDDRVVVIVESKAYSEDSYPVYKNDILWQVKTQYTALKEKLWIDYVQCFVCLPRLHDLHEQRQRWIEIADIESLEWEIDAYMKEQSRYHKTPIKAKETILAMKYH